MSTAAVVIGVSLVIVLVIALVFAVRRCYRPANRYRRGIPNLARARERPKVWAAGTAGAISAYYTGARGGARGGGCGGGGG